MAIQLVTLHCFLTLTCSLTHHDKLVYNFSLPPSRFCYGCPLNWHTSLSLLSLSLFLSHEACNPSLSSSLCYPSSPTHLPCLSPPKPTPEESCLSSKARGGLDGCSKMCGRIPPITASFSSSSSSSSPMLQPSKSVKFPQILCPMIWMFFSQFNVHNSVSK